MKALVALLLRRGFNTPYTSITSADGHHIYMNRWWIFNPYGKDAEGGRIQPCWPWLPSIRLHHILVPDQDRDLHDHPWNARTVVLRGWYIEEREDRTYVRRAGDTAAIRVAQFHRIAQVSPGGVWTLFITWRYRGTWGFKVDGVKVPRRAYLGRRVAAAQATDCARLDYLESHCKRDNASVRMGAEFKTVTAWAIASDPGLSLREAVDSAMQQQGGGQ